MNFPVLNSQWNPVGIFQHLPNTVMNEMWSIAKSVSLAAIATSVLKMGMSDSKPTEPRQIRQSWTNTTQCPRIESIFQGGCLTDDVSKPLALVLSTTEDWNGIFSFTQQKNKNHYFDHDILANNVKQNRDFFTTLAKTHTTCHHYIQDSSESNDRIEQLGQEKLIDVFVSRAHGGALIERYAKELVSPYSPSSHFAALRSRLSPDATIILHSCLNAASCGEGDFAGFIRSMAPPKATVYAPTSSSNRIEIQSGTPPIVKIFYGEMDITYRSGADGYCNNPHELLDVYQEKLNSLEKLGSAIKQDDPIYQAAVNAADEASKSTDYARRYNAIDLFDRLVDKGYGFDEAVSAGSDVSKSTGYFRVKGLELLRKLVEKGQGFEPAKSAVCDASKSTDPMARSSAKVIAEKLAAQGQHFTCP